MRCVQIIRLGRKKEKNKMPHEAFVRQQSGYYNENQNYNPAIDDDGITLRIYTTLFIRL